MTAQPLPGTRDTNPPPPPCAVTIASPDSSPTPPSPQQQSQQQKLRHHQKQRQVHSSLSLLTPPEPLAPSVKLPTRVRIVEVSPRDGLQNELNILPTADKLWLIRALSEAGLRNIEATSFVSPRRVPQLSDASALITALQPLPSNPQQQQQQQRKQLQSQPPNKPAPKIATPVVSDLDGVDGNITRYPVLVPNARGLSDALAAGARDIAIFAAATDAFSRANLNCDRREALARFRPLVASAVRQHGLRVRAYISCAIACPYEGPVRPEVVADLARTLYHDVGCAEIALGDTIGVGNPCSIVRLVDAVVSRGQVPVEALAIHCHDTRGTALANVLAAMSRGVAVVDASVAGLGGCPFAPGAAGNVPTEDVVHMLQGMGVDVGPISLTRLANVGREVCAKLGRETGSRVAQALLNSPEHPKLADASVTTAKTKSATTSSPKPLSTRKN